MTRAVGHDDGSIGMGTLTKDLLLGIRLRKCERGLEYIDNAHKHQFYLHVLV